jgi:hypothetical protein
MGPTNSGVCAASVLLLLAAGTARGHADYEVPAMTVPGQAGPLNLVRHYTDGIVCGDPSKLVVRDAAGDAVAETPYFRDVLLRRSPGGKVLVFGVGYYSVLYQEAWVLEGGRLVPYSSPWCYWHAFLAAVRGHWLGYGFTVLLCVWAARARAGRPWRVPPGNPEGVAFTWLILVFMYGSLSVPLALALALGGVAALALLAWSPLGRGGRAASAE